MDSARPIPAGYLMSNLIDQDIAHIRRVMPLSLSGDLAGPILPPLYWRQRLHRLLDTGHVNKGQLGEIDSLLHLLDAHDTRDGANTSTHQRTASGSAHY
jgi:hypothetical protein